MTAAEQRPFFAAARIVFCVLWVFGGWLSAEVSQATYTDVTQTAGVGYTQYGAGHALNCDTQPFGECHEIDKMSGGAATADVDSDGWPDLYVTRIDDTDLLFRNLGNGQFSNFSVQAGLSQLDLQSNGAGFADVDNDGDPDLYVTTFGSGSDPASQRFRLLINNGSGVFTDETILRNAGVHTSQDRGGFSVSFGDYDGDGWVDIHVAEWIREAVPIGSLPHTRLLRNRGASQPGYFDDVTRSAGVESDQSQDCQNQWESCESFAFASSFVDLDQDGHPDLPVVSDFGTSQLFWNQGDGTFVEGGASAGIGTDENGMGSAFGDYDNDGDMDWFVSSIYIDPADCFPGYCRTGNRLYENIGNRQFVDSTDQAGVRDGAWGWGAVFLDADNDADLDLVMTNGVDLPSSPLYDPFRGTPMRYWENDGSGVMTESAQAMGLTDTGEGKGLLTFDYDRDGDLDIFIVRNGAGGLLYRNDHGNQKNWMRVSLLGSVSGTDAWGARIELLPQGGGTQQVREIGARSHFLGQSERVAHFGLGSSELLLRYGVTVHWPSGRMSVLNDLAPNQTLVVREVEAPEPGQAFQLVAGLLTLVRLARRRRFKAH